MDGGLISVNLKYTEAEVRLPQSIHGKAPFFAEEMGGCSELYPAFNISSSFSSTSALL